MPAISNPPSSPGSGDGPPQHRRLERSVAGPSSPAPTAQWPKQDHPPADSASGTVRVCAD
eukprot:6472501-Amphidinium_carterae.2